jgi:hypothetical protein
MRLIAALLASVSLASLLAAGSPAIAQSLSGVVVEGTGAFVMGPNNPAQGQIPTDSFSSIVNPFTGYYAGLRIGKEIMPMWDVTGRVAYTHFNGSTGSYVEPGKFGSSDKIGEINDELAFQTLDLEAGYTPALDGSMQLRFFGGLRGLHYTSSLQDTANYTFSGGPETRTVTHESEFYGVGPRVGLEFSNRFGDSPFGISGMAGGAVIVGTETTTNDKVGTVTNGSQVKTIVDLEAAVGLDFHLSDQAVITGGVRGEVLSNVNSFSSGDQSQLAYGPFAKFKLNF